MTIGVSMRMCAIALALLSAASLGGVTPSGPAVLDVPGRSDDTPWVAASGSFVAVAWGASTDGKTDVVLSISLDGGSTFSTPVRVNPVAGEARLGGELPPRVALVPRHRDSSPEIVVLWTARGARTEIKTARSRDGGRTFDAPIALQSEGALGDRGWPAVALDREGVVHAVWLDHRGLAAERAARGEHAGHHSGAEHDGVAMARKSALYYASATEQPSAEQALATGVCYCCKTALASGPDGSVYAAWRHVYTGNLRDIAFTMSRNGGRAFSRPVRVSEDRWAINGCPDDGPAMAVDAGGRVHLVWPTVIDGDNPEGAIFYASTRDGRSFTPRVRIPTLGGPKPSHPQIVIDRGGRMFVAWDESVNGRRVAAARELQPRADGAPASGDVVMLSPNGPAMYPALAATDKGLVAVWTTGGDPSRVEVRTVPMPRR